MSNVNLTDEHIDEPKKAFKVGDYVFGGDWCYGIITDITENIATVEFETLNGGGSIGFELSEPTPAFSPKKPTNYDLIRNMSVEELAQFMNDCGHDFPPYCDYKDATRGLCDQNCLKCAKEWLESEVTE